MWLATCFCHMHRRLSHAITQVGSLYLVRNTCKSFLVTLLPSMWLIVLHVIKMLVAKLSKRVPTEEWFLVKQPEFQEAQLCWIHNCSTLSLVGRVIVERRLVTLMAFLTISGSTGDHTMYIWMSGRVMDFTAMCRLRRDYAIKWQ